MTNFVTNSGVDTLNIDDSTLGVNGTNIAARGWLSVDNQSAIDSNDSVTLIASDGGSHTFTAGTEFVSETDNNTTATNLATAINLSLIHI